MEKFLIKYEKVMPGQSLVDFSYRNPSHLNSFLYVEMDGEFIETPFQHFEEVPQTLASAEAVVEDSPMKITSFKDAQAVVEKGGCAN